MVKMLRHLKCTKLLLGLIMAVLLVSACGSKPEVPQVTEINPQPLEVLVGDSVIFSVEASGVQLEFEWQAIEGTIEAERGGAKYIAPASPCEDEVQVYVTSEGAMVNRTWKFKVVAPTPTPTPPPTETPTRVITSTPALPDTPSLTPTQTATPAFTDTPTPSESPTPASTRIPTSTFTPVPSDTAISMVTPTKTRTSPPARPPTPTPTPGRPSAPTLTNPPDRAQYHWGDLVTLEWTWQYDLEDDWQFAVDVWPADKYTDPERESRTWTESNSFDLHLVETENSFPSDFPRGIYCWHVFVLRPMEQSEQAGWALVSVEPGEGDSRCFEVVGDDGPGPIPGPTATPTIPK
jgi:hypothetical protein